MTWKEETAQFPPHLVCAADSLECQPVSANFHFGLLFKLHPLHTYLEVVPTEHSETYFCIDMYRIALLMK